MRVLIANHSRTIVGGAETYLARLLPRGAKLGIEWRLLVEGETAGQTEIDAGTGVFVWSFATVDERRLRREINGWQPDVVFVHGLNDHNLEAWLSSSFPCVLFAHNYYGTCLTGEKHFRVPRVKVCTRVFGASCFAYCYSRQCGSLDPRRLVDGYKKQSHRRRLLGRYHRVVVASTAMQTEFVRHGVRPERTVLLPPFVEPGSREIKAGNPTDPVAYVGRLTENKGIGVLVEAMARLTAGPGVTGSKLFVIGDGPARSGAQARAEGLGVDATFTGWLSSAETEALLDQSSVLAIPSLWPEPFGLVGLEAAIRARPVVAFPVGGIPDWLESGVVGEMPAVGDFSAKGLAAALRRAREDSGHYNELCTNAYQLAQRYSAATHLRALREVFQQVSEETRR